MKRELTASRKEAEVLLANRKLWKGELVDLQREFAKELDCLRKISDKQISHYKDKIHELEDLNRKKSLTRRELEKLQNSNTERQTLQSEIQLKEAENIILHQVKDYYQARLRESESQMGRSEFRTTQAILTRRPNKKRLCNNEVASHRVLETKEQVFERRRYAITSAKKHYNLSLSKGRLEENEHRPHKSSSSLCETWCWLILWNDLDLKQLLLEGMYNKYFRSDDEHEIIDIHEMFLYYNTFFFQDTLEKCYVEWSQKMTLCAGTCTHSSYDSCTIKLSAPLLQYRTANELKETLLHEMIHAFLFLTNPSACLSEGGHGKEFQ